MFRILDKKPHLFVPLLMFFMGGAPLALALLSEFGFGYAPCPLCIYQRGPYALIAIVAVLMPLLGSRTHLNRFLFLCAALFILDAGIAGFHVGVEQHWWEGLEGCRDDIVARTVDELKNALMNTPIARCDEPALTVIGLSMAAWNFVYAFAAGIFTFMLFGRYSK